MKQLINYINESLIKKDTKTKPSTNDRGKLAELLFQNLTGKDNITKPSDKKKTIEALIKQLKEMEIDNISQLVGPKYHFETFLPKGSSYAWKSKYKNVLKYYSGYYDKFYDDWTIGDDISICTIKKDKYYIHVDVTAAWNFIGIVYTIGETKEINYDNDDAYIFLYERKRDKSNRSRSIYYDY